MNGPCIAGEHVRLRPHQPADAQIFADFLADPEVIRYLSIQCSPSLSDEQKWIEESGTNPNALGWTIEVSSAAIGVVGFDHIDWRNQHATVGIFIGKKSLWGTGLATEIAQLVADYGFYQMNLRKIKSAFLAPNLASAKLQANIGLREVGRFHDEFYREGRWIDLVLTECTRADWLALL